MIRTQISLEREQAEALRRLAEKRGVSMSALIRGAVDRMVDADDWERRVARAMRLAGKYDSGRTDIGRNHDKYLAEDYAK